MCRLSHLSRRNKIVNMYVIIELERSVALYMHRRDDEENQLCTNTMYIHIRILKKNYLFESL